MKKIWFDMDGTIADLYGVENWLDYLLNGDAFPYKAAAPLLHLSTLARMLNRVQREGYEIGVISWLSKNSTADYDEKVKAAKLEWLARHLPSVKWDTVFIVAYGTNKHETCGAGILFDDEDKNREIWGEGAHTPDEILKVLSSLLA